MKSVQKLQARFLSIKKECALKEKKYSMENPCQKINLVRDLIDEIKSIDYKGGYVTEVEKIHLLHGRHLTAIDRKSITHLLNELGGKIRNEGDENWYVTSKKGRKLYRITLINGNAYEVYIRDIKDSSRTGYLTVISVTGQEEVKEEKVDVMMETQPKTYRELQQELKKLRQQGVVVKCRLNSKKQALIDELKRIQNNT